MNTGVGKAIVLSVLVFICVLLYGFTLPSMLALTLGQTDKARVITTKANLKILHNAVAQFKMDTGRYPTQEEGLSILITQPSDVKGYQPGGYIDATAIPKDAWGNDFVFVAYPEFGKPYVIISDGADGQEGGEGYDADLYSTDAE
ncbi:MAG: type II secretion system major pseudopilin GspG [Sedimentisphaerales bacterium]